MLSKRNMGWMLSAALLAGSTAGCVTRGKEFPSDTAWIKEGATQKVDVQRILGEPFSVGTAGGRPSWTYGYYDYNLFGKSHQKELKLYWTPDGLVSTYSFNSSFPDDIAKGVPTGGAKGKKDAHEPSQFD